MKKHEKNNLFHKIQHNIVYRLTAALAVCIFPLVLMTLILVFMVMNRASEQVNESYAAQLAGSMNYMQMRVESIDTRMDDFVTDYVSILNASSASRDDIILYEMLDDVAAVLSDSSLYGIVGISDLQQNISLAQVQSDRMSSKENVNAVEAMKTVMQSGELADGSYRKIGAEYYYFRVYSYRNYEVVIGISIGENVALNCASFFSEKSEVFVGFKDFCFRLDADGTVGAEYEKNPKEDSFFQNVVSWGTESGIAAVYVRSNTKAWQMIPIGYWGLFVTAILCIFLASQFWKLLRLEVLDPFEKLTDAMEQIQEEKLDFRLEDHNKRNSDEVQYLFDTFDKMAKEVEASKEKDKKMFQAELDNIRLQVNPHMLLNSFNMIYSLAQTQNYECIQDYSLHLVDYFRYALRKNDDMVPLRQEFDFVKSYIEIQKIRFPKSFSCVYDVGENCMEALVPPLLIQNFVENAMKYALKPGEMIEVLINIRKEEQRLLVSVCDTGRGIKPEILEKLQCGEQYVDRTGNKHYGVWNCKRRIELFYEEKAQIHIMSKLGEGTQVFLDLPFVEGTNETFNRG
jgi:signal transduction histidine kinase